MLNGYITYRELKLLTGYSDVFLSKLIVRGLNLHEADLDYNKQIKDKRKDRYSQTLFNLDEVEQWLKAHIF